MRIIINASRTRLSDEEIDPIEQDDFDASSNLQGDGWMFWDEDDLIDIRRIINERMPPKEKEVVLSFLNGVGYKQLGVTEKYWRYHFQRAIDLIKKEMKL